MNATVSGPPLHGRAGAVLAGATFEPVTSGPRTRVWRAGWGDDRADVAVKAAAWAVDGRTLSTEERAEAVTLVHAEAERLVWVTEHLHGRGLGLPELVAVPEPGDPEPVLVTGWLEGTTDPRFLRTPEVAVENFGRALASLHEASRRIDLDRCPFDASLTDRIRRAGERVRDGLVDTSGAEAPYDRYSPEQLLDRVRQMAETTGPPGPEDRVLLHGDLCVSNVIFDPAYSSTVGAIDWTFAGVGDRHQDLAITARSLSRNLSGEVLPDFFTAYGLEEPDLLRIETYVVLEELF